MNSVQPDRPEWLIEHRQEIATLANKVGAQLTGSGIDALRSLVDQNDVAYAVWNDAEAFDGMGILAIKGTQAMREIVAEGVTLALSITAFPCRGEIEAQALCEMMGEPDVRH